MLQQEIKYYICRSLNLIDLIKLFLKGVIENNKIIICHIDSNKLTLFINRNKCLSKIMLSNIISLKRLDVDTACMYTSEGKPIVQEAYYDGLNKIMDEVDENILNSKYSITNFLNNKLRSIKKEIRLYMKHQIAYDIFDDLLLVEIAKWFSNNTESMLYGTDFTLIIHKKSYWSHFAYDYARDNKVKSIYSYGIPLRKNLLFRFTYYLLNTIIGSIIGSIKYVIKHDKNKQLKTTGNIGIPYYHFNNFTDFHNKRNYYLFWYPESNIEPHRIIIYADGNINILDDEKGKIEGYGFNILSCYNLIDKNSRSIPQYYCSFKAIRILTEYVKELVKLFNKINNKVSYEEYKLLALLFVKLPYWEEFFIENSIKIKFRFHDLFTCRDIAAMLSGVTTMSFHYSNHSKATILHQDICDIFFIWGKEYERHFINNHSNIKNIIQSGYIFDYTFNVLASEAGNLRESFADKSVDFVISVFDESLVSGNIFSLKTNFLNFYKSILEYIYNNKTVGIIIKPKKNSTRTFLESSELTSEYMRILVNEGRLKILDSTKFPVEAGRASNIAIGMIAESTAALECSLAGVPTIIYDCTNLRNHHPVYDWGDNKVVFDSLKKMLECIDDYRCYGKSVNGFGDWSQILKHKDPFQDGKGNQRIGLYIKTLLLQLDKGLAKDEAIKAANQSYANEFGRDKITSLN